MSSLFQSKKPPQSTLPNLILKKYYQKNLLGIGSIHVKTGLFSADMIDCAIWTHNHQAFDTQKCIMKAASKVGFQGLCEILASPFIPPVFSSIGCYAVGRITSKVYISYLYDDPISYTQLFLHSVTEVSARGFEKTVPMLMEAIYDDTPTILPIDPTIFYVGSMLEGMTKMGINSMLADKPSTNTTLVALCNDTNVDL